MMLSFNEFCSVENIFGCKFFSFILLFFVSHIFIYLNCTKQKVKAQKKLCSMRSIKYYFIFFIHNSFHTEKFMHEKLNLKCAQLYYF